MSTTSGSRPQHPFPAQGQTTDTAHLIVAEHASQHGSYVALTRARERTDIYAAIDPPELDQGQDKLAALAETISRSEPEVPSIDTPLDHETATDTEHDLKTRHRDNERVIAREHEPGWEI